MRVLWITLVRDVLYLIVRERRIMDQVHKDQEAFGSGTPEYRERTNQFMNQRVDDANQSLKSESDKYHAETPRIAKVTDTAEKVAGQARDAVKTAAGVASGNISKGELVKNIAMKAAKGVKGKWDNASTKQKVGAVAVAATPVALMAAKKLHDARKAKAEREKLANDVAERVKSEPEQ